MNRYESLDELAKEYALTNEQLLEYLISNGIDSVGDLDKIDLTDKIIIDSLGKIKGTKAQNNHENHTGLNSIAIEGLFGKYNYYIDFKEDISIWVSENGVGKTTILNIIVAVLTGDQDTLMDINFEKVIVNILGESYTIERNKYVHIKNESMHSERTRSLFEALLMYIPRQYSIKLRNDFRRKGYVDLDLIKDLSYNFFENDSNSMSDSRITYILRELKELQYAELSKILYNIKDKLEGEVLFYPTYRRIEAGLDKVFFNRRKNYREHDLSPKYMRFGMNDVKSRISNLLDKMRKDANTAYIEMNANIISELLKKSVREYIVKENLIDVHKVDVIIKRIGEERIENIDSLKSMLSPSNKTLLPNADFLLYYLQKLVKIYDAQKPLDSKLRTFCNVCTKYLSSKNIVYDETLLTIDIVDHNNEKIDFEDLSSGEKQVVSIFSKVYLDIVTPCIFIIDEPEISLSIEWQKEFLQDIFNSEKIGLMLVTTHSPFIFKNEYRKFVAEISKYEEI